MDVSGALVREVFEELVRAPSENPPGDERAVAAVVRAWLEQDGFEVREVALDPRRPNVIGTLRRGLGRRLILQGHADTKPARTDGTLDLWSFNPYEVTERDGRLYGLGACDTKGGLAAQLAAARLLVGHGDWSGELVVQAVADEEDGSELGAQLLLEEGELVGDSAVVAEPTSCYPSHAQLGNAWAEVMVCGVGAHAGRPQLGIDAFEAAERYLAVLRGLVAEQPHDPVFPGHPRVNVGDLLAPGHPGTVAGQCRLRCDIRVLPGQERDAVLGLYEEAAERLRGPGLHVEVTRYQGGGCQSHQIGLDAPVLLALHEAGGTGREPTRGAFFGGTDARFFAQAGTPAVVYGPGHLDQAHAPDEYVETGQLEDAVRTLTAASRAYLSSWR